ncbi:hypothetical protein [Mycolicibacterium bacteremicum]|uniref:DUF7847 domain-containing protein n=1 Tax=Mycolicibacterium bacteremicum TaxID=564198 RepID=A0A1W9YQ74_MYCBA|nr:hypothetical protein [Mycolicibacterium bacteremicum]MCV7430214.1 hypothetical protein [Mycolicibacterium bacteremicum]ORA02228.1 hypothetical protein BST17_24655 [Mycolicibacterium bacteremicum]
MTGFAGGYQPYYPPPQYCAPPPLKPGIIPLRPLNLSDIFNGAFAYIRANPKTTLGLTTIVVLLSQLASLLLQVGPLAAAGALEPVSDDATYAELDAELGGLIGSLVGSLAGAAATWISSILLSGLLTVIVGRAIFGAGISAGEAWRRLRPRLLALLGVTALETLGAVLLLAAVGTVIAVVAIALNGWVAFFVGVPLVLAALVALAFVFTKLSFAPTLVVLERLPVIAAIERSFALVRNDFWRIFGIRLLAMLVAGVIAGAVSVPFSLGGQILMIAAGSAAATVGGLVLVTVGAAIGQILTAPFTAGVVVLQYTDRRIRAEAFDLVLQTGAGHAPAGPQDSTDHLWLTRRP